jgi:choline dehydrogenase-like flavoprotein
MQHAELHVNVQTAGLCIAARLTEDPDVSVLVIEAGGSHLGDAEIREYFSTTRPLFC